MSSALAAKTDSPPISGVVDVSGREYTVQRWVTLLLTVGPFVGFVWAVRALWGHGMSGTDLGLFIGFYAFTGLGITVGFHRYLAHKSFRAPAGVRAALAIAGSLAVEGSVISWVATHRRHHAYSDRPGDPHSPHLQDTATVRGALRGLWFAHTGWLFKPEKTSRERWAPDLLKDPVISRIDALFPRLTLVSFLLPGLFGLALTRSLSGTITALLWGGVARVFLLHHVTWSVNSICHFFGKRPLAVKDESRNNWMLSVLSFGEAWHNNHHAFPSSAWLGLRAHQIDLGRYLIWTLERLRLASDVRRIPAEEIEAKRVAALR